MKISEFDYDLPEERIARFPPAERDASRLLVWRPEHHGESAGLSGITETTFSNIGSVLPSGSLLIFNNTRVIRARLVMHRPAAPGSPDPGARIEVLCLEPSTPADYERAFAAKGRCEWSCMVGNSKKWKSGPVEIPFIYNGSEHKLLAWRDCDVIARNGETKQSGLSTPDCFEQSSRNDVNARHEHIVRFEWDADLTFGELLELLGRVPIPPYLGRDSEEVDDTRYQTVYARIEGSVAAPTAGLHFTPELIRELCTPANESDFFVKSAAVQRSRKIREGSLPAVNDRADFERKEAKACFSRKIEVDEVTLHVGAGTFLPVKVENALDHPMHTEHFEVTLATVEHLLKKHGRVIAVGTTSVRTLESLPALAWRIRQTGEPESERPVGQFEPYDIQAEFGGAEALGIIAGYMRARGLEKIAASTRIMITPSERFRFRIVSGIVTNFHQPKSTLLLLIAAFTGGNAHGELSGDGKLIEEEWRRIYDYALANDFRFLSYGDSSLLLGGGFDLCPRPAAGHQPNPGEDK